MNRLLLVVLVLLAGMALGMLWLRPPASDGLPENRSYGRAQIGGAFEMVNHLGAPYTHEHLKGKYSLIYFGFTYCPDICPAGLLVIANTIDALPEAVRGKLQPIFVTVDPERDTVPVIRQYVENFHPQIMGLTGSEAHVSAIAKAYKVYYNKHEDAEHAGQYLVDHSGYMYLMGPKGEYITHFPHNVSMQNLADGLRSHIPH